jgi:hypothetical protein
MGAILDARRAASNVSHVPAELLVSGTHGHVKANVDASLAALATRLSPRLIRIGSAALFALAGAAVLVGAAMP